MANPFTQAASETADLILELVTRKAIRDSSKSNVSTKRSEELTHDRHDTSSTAATTLPTPPAEKGYLLVTTPTGFTWLAPGVESQVLTMISGMPAWHYPPYVLTTQPDYSIVVGGTPVTSGGAWVVEEP